MKKLAPAALALAIVAGGAAWWSSQQASGTQLPQLGAAEAQTTGDADTSRVIEMTLGNPDAPVTVVEYASFTCPHCANFHRNVLPEIKANYIDSGQVHWIKREVYFDPYGLWAGMVARCGGEERYFGIVDMIYETQRDWAAGNDGAQVADNLRRLGRRAGLNNDELNACLEDQDMAQAMVAVYQANASADNVRATPSFMINGTAHPNMSYGDFATVLDGLLGN